MSHKSWSARFVPACLVMTLGLTAYGAEQGQAAQKFGRPGTVKARLPKSSVDLTLAGVRAVADYGSFIVVEADPSTVAEIANAQELTEENQILLNSGAIDTTTPAAKMLASPRPAVSGKSLHLIQFAGPIQPQWHDALSQTGVQIISYIPSNAYLVYGDAIAITAMQALAEDAPHIQWNGAFDDAYKIHPNAARIAALNAANPKAAQDQLFTIQLVIDADANPATFSMIDRLKTAQIVSQSYVLHYVNIVVKLPSTRIADLARQPDVVSIQPYEVPRLLCERQDMIVSGNVSTTGGVLSPSGPGYLAWLASQGFTQAQFTASGFVVDVSDSAIDNGSASPNHFGLWEGGILGSTSHVSYNNTINNTTVGASPTQHGCDGHGNLNAHIIGGFDDSSGFPFADSSGFHYGLGVCPFVPVGSSVIFTGTVSLSFTNPDYATLQSNAYTKGARISSNSWGNTSGNNYNVDSQEYDVLVRDAKSGTAGNQEMVIVFAAGNSGPGSNSVHPPATAKNIISVGATENVQSVGGTDASGVGDSGSDNANDIISFSGRGPTSDGRRKPEIVAPGTHVSGGVSQAVAIATGTGTADACFVGSEVSGGSGGSIFFPNIGQQFYSASSGTSHSTPAVAGGCALIRQYFINQGMSPPSAAMTKAFLVNSARYLTGVSANDTLWSNSQGMGMMDLGAAFGRNAGNSIIRDQVAGDMFTTSGETREFTGSIFDSTQPFRVTLAWTDAPGSTSGNAYNNNLDLTVTVNGITYMGNAFSGENSTIGGTADVKNNVESVFLPAGTFGDYTVTVTATNINSDGVPGNVSPLDQDFALVIFNSSSCPFMPIEPASLPQAEVTSVYSQQLTTSVGTAPFTWSLASGTLPTGITLSAGGLLSGTPTMQGNFNFTVQVVDNTGCISTSALSIFALLTDCNNNGIADSLDIANGTSKDCNNNGIPDECDVSIVQADAGSIQKITVGGSVTLGATPSAFSGTPPYQFAWKLQLGTSTQTSTAANPTFKLTVPGIYAAHLDVTDATGCKASSDSIVNVDASSDAAQNVPGCGTMCGATGSGLTLALMVIGTCVARGSRRRRRR